MRASTLPALRVDGGMTANELLLQIQADVLGLPVVRPAVTETTALGAAYAAGLAVGFWSSLDELRAQRARRALLDAAGDGATERERGYALWNAAVERSLDSADREPAPANQCSRVCREPATEPAGDSQLEEGGWTTANASSEPSSSARSR